MHAWLRPTLLERLTDHAPDRRHEAPASLPNDESQLRQSILRDLAWLFNTTHVAADVDLSGFPEIQRSVLNYGIPNFSGRVLSKSGAEELKRAIATALANYETRLIRETIDVTVSKAETALGKPAVLIEISAVLRLEPLPATMRLRAELDLESGHVAVADELSQT